MIGIGVLVLGAASITIAWLFTLLWFVDRDRRGALELLKNVGIHIALFFGMCAVVFAVIWTGLAIDPWVTRWLLG